MRKGLLIFVAAAVILVAQDVPESGRQGQPANTRPANTAGASSASAQDLCAIEGLVTNAVTGQPLEGVALTLNRVALPQNTTELNFPRGNLATGHVAKTDAAGKFVMNAIEPGTYRVLADHEGFTSIEYGARKPRQSGTTIRLVPRRRVANVDFKLTPHGVLTGRVLDEKRQPLARVHVRALVTTFTNARRMLVPASAALTNDLGEYRLPLPAGRYYLAAVPLPQPPSERSAQPEPGNARETYVATYYPGTIDAQAAAPLHIYGGSEFPGNDLVLLKSPTVRVSGRVINETGDVTKEPIPVALRLPEVQQFATGITPTRADEEGRFEFLGVVPGRYDLLTAFRGENIQVIARQPLDVDREDIDDVKLVIGPGMEVRGEVGVDDSQTMDFASVEARLAQDGHYGGMLFPHEPTIKLHDDGTFVLPHVSPNHYVLHLNGLPDGYYIQSVYMGSVEGLENGLDLLNGPAGPIRVVISKKAGVVDSLVTDDAKKPVAGATVVLVPESPKRRTRPRFYTQGTTDHNGHVTLRNVKPGEYQIYAWESIASREWMDPEFMAPFRGKGKKVSISQMGQVGIALTVLSVP